MINSTQVLKNILKLLQGLVSTSEIRLEVPVAVFVLVRRHVLEVTTETFQVLDEVKQPVYLWDQELSTEKVLGFVEKFTQVHLCIPEVVWWNWLQVNFK
jgi:hypothetical protein